MDSSTFSFTSDRITTWSDKSSNSNDFVQGTTLLAPTLRKVSGDKDSLYMAAATQGMRTENVLPSAVCGANPRSMFFVCQAAQLTSYVTVGYGNHTVAVPRNSFGLNNAANVTTIFSPYTYGTDVTLSSANYGLCLLEGFYDGTRMYGYVNGTAIGSTAIVLNTSQTVLYLGNRPDNLGNVLGTSCEVILYSGMLTESRREQMEGYLAWKWGIEGSLPAGHPFKSVPPTRND